MKKATFKERPLEPSPESVRSCPDVIGWRKKFSKHRLRLPIPHLRRLSVLDTKTNCKLFLDIALKNKAENFEDLLQIKTKNVAEA